MKRPCLAHCVANVALTRYPRFRGRLLAVASHQPNRVLEMKLRDRFVLVENPANLTPIRLL